MDKRLMCVRTKEIHPGVFKTVSNGFVRIQSGQYRVPIGTVLIPDRDAMIVRTEWGSVYWCSDPVNNWIIGWLLPSDFSVKESDMLMCRTSEEFFDEESVYIESKIEYDGTMWMLRIAEKNNRRKLKYLAQKILKYMLGSNQAYMRMAV